MPVFPPERATESLTVDSAFHAWRPICKCEQELCKVMRTEDRRLYYTCAK